MDVLDSPVRQQQTILMFEVSASLGYAIDDLLCKRPIVADVCAGTPIYGWFLGAVVLEDAIGFV